MRMPRSVSSEAAVPRGANMNITFTAYLVTGNSLHCLYIYIVHCSYWLKKLYVVKN